MLVQEWLYQWTKKIGCFEFGQDKPLLLGLSIAFAIKRTGFSKMIRQSDERMMCFDITLNFNFSP
jgi:hypothetical protein